MAWTGPAIICQHATIDGQLEVVQLSMPSSSKGHQGSYPYTDVRCCRTVVKHLHETASLLKSCAGRLRHRSNWIAAMLKRFNAFNVVPCEEPSDWSLDERSGLSSQACVSCQL